MPAKEIQIYIDRIERFYQRLPKAFIQKYIHFDAEYSHSKDPVSFKDRLDGKYTAITEGENWGKAWESAWFKLTAKVPEDWAGMDIYAELDFSGEGLVFDAEGKALQGITNGSIWDPNFARNLVPLKHVCADETLELWIEAAANSLFGVYLDADPDQDNESRFGYFDAKVEKIRLGVFSRDVWHLWLDMRVIRGLILRLPEESVRRARVIRAANDAINIYLDNPENAAAARKALETELGKPASASDLKVSAVGHAHIDTGWLWPVRETIRKCARTFATQLSLMEEYPDYIFGASQPQHYAFIKQHYPDIYTGIKRAVKKGQWELQGAMWVEADANLISGESMIRQILHGKNFYMDEFGVNVDNLWLPDVFGYSAALPQILKQSGVDFFLTQKLSWNQYNEFPHHTFKWRGIDGTEILTHFPPENTYNSELDTEFLIPAQTNFKERAFIDEFISLFGVGDGGGGPKPENIELGRRMQNLEGSPRVKFGSARDFFHRLGSYEDKLETWSGELYMEAHRGTLTSQALVKKANRQLEQQLRAVEYLWSLLPLDAYPARELDQIWKTTLLNQFHDIIPGSSINAVYQVTHREHADCLDQCQSLITSAAEKLFMKSKDSLVLVNILHDAVSQSIQLPDSWKNCNVADEDGNPVPVQLENEHPVALVSVKPYSYLTLRKSDGSLPDVRERNSLILENEQVRYEFAEDGSLLSGVLKTNGMNIIEPGQAGNRFSLYEDRPNNWDAWDIDIFYQDAVCVQPAADSWQPGPAGAVRCGLRFDYHFANSSMTQAVFLDSKTARLDFLTTVDWREKHKMLRVAFPVDVYFDQASYDIQYGYVKRPTHQNTSWDKARFEVAAHRYADLSDNDKGVALLNDCKYGHRIHNNVIDLNLLRSPNNPDPDADQGLHEFKYCLFPHAGDLIHSDVINQAAAINQKLIVLAGYSSIGKQPPVSVTGNGISLESVKKAEKEDCLILRIVETLGCHSKGLLHLPAESTLIKTDLMEWENNASQTVNSQYELSLHPFEIQTYKLRLS